MYTPIYTPIYPCSELKSKTRISLSEQGPPHPYTPIDTPIHPYPPLTENKVHGNGIAMARQGHMSTYKCMSMTWNN